MNEANRSSTASQPLFNRLANFRKRFLNFRVLLFTNLSLNLKIFHASRELFILISPRYSSDSNISHCWKTAQKPRKLLRSKGSAKPSPVALTAQSRKSEIANHLFSVELKNSISEEIHRIEVNHSTIHRRLVQPNIENSSYCASSFFKTFVSFSCFYMKITFLFNLNLKKS